MGPVVRRPISAGVELLSGFLFLSFKSILELSGNFKLKLNLLFSPFKSLTPGHWHLFCLGWQIPGDGDF